MLIESPTHHPSYAFFSYALVLIPSSYAMWSSRRVSRWSTEDRISELPDPVLCNILSLLPTKLATSTSILSKRWKSLYHSLFNLDFDDSTFQNFQTFRHFVYSIMLSRDPTVRLESFHFKSGHCTHYDQYDINRFVNNAVQSGIQSLKLNLSQSIKLPPSVLNCKTLTVLKLKMLTVNVLPSVVDFPLLKTLILDLVSFRRHRFLINLISGCPSLEDLHSQCLRVIEDSRFHWGRSSEGDIKSIANLVRANVSNFHIPFNLLYKAESLRVELNYLYFPHDFGFYNLTQLELVFASKRSHSHWKWKWLAELFNYCPKLQNLTLHEDCTYGNNYYDDWTDPRNVPECLSSQLKTCLLKGYKGTKCELQFAKYIMQNSKVLHTMTIWSTDSVSLDMKHEMLMNLSLCPRGSASCELVFD